MRRVACLSPCLRDSVVAQSTLEYILVLAAILVAVIIAANSFIRPAVNQQMNQSGEIINKSANTLKTNLGL